MTESTMPSRLVTKIGRHLYMLVVGFLIGAVVLFTGVGAVAYVQNGSYNTDGWWILATGRYIVEHGIPHTNPWGMVDGAAIVVQQWLHDVIVWVLYDLGGFAGIDVLACVFILAVFLTAWLAMLRLSRGRIAWGVAVFSMFSIWSGVLSYINVRPTPWSMIAFMVIAVICQKYRETGSKKVLFVLPVVTLLHANLHISQIALDIATMCAFLIPESFVAVKQALTSKEGIVTWWRLTWPLVVAIVASVLAALVNPYGLDGFLYTLNSMSEAAYGHAISEMQPAFNSSEPTTIFSTCLWIFSLVGIPMLTLIKHRRAPELTWWVLLVGGCVSYLMAIRNLWIFALAGILFTARVYAFTDRPQGPEKPARVLPALISITVVFFIVSSVASVVVKASPDLSKTAKSWNEMEARYKPLADWLIEADVPDDFRIFTDTPFVYSYLEFRELPVMFDYRPEIWASKNAGVDTGEPYRTYIDAIQSKESLEKYMHENDFDAAIVLNDDVENTQRILGGTIVKATDTCTLIVFNKDYL